MKRAAAILAIILSLSLLSGCMPAVVVTSPEDKEFQAAWDEAMDEVQGNCQKDEEDGFWSAWAEEWEDWSEDGGERFSGMDTKNHFWKVLDAGGQEVSAITDEEMVKALDGLLCNDDTWKSLEKNPADPAYSYVYSQEKTLLAGQDPSAEREYEDLLAFTVSASEDVVTLQILGGLEELSLLPGLPAEDVLTFSFEVSAEIAETLRNPDQFSE